MRALSFHPLLTPYRSCLLLLLLLLAACGDDAPSSQPPPVVASVIVGYAPQTDPPALWLSDNGAVAFWIGSDDAGVHHDVRRLTDTGTPAPAVVLPLPPNHPYLQTAIAGDDARAHLLWIDEGEAHVNVLYSALISSELTVERGPTQISDGLALRYAAVSDGAGGVWAAWSGGLVSEPGVYAQQIDTQGRPRPPQRAAENSDYPAVIRSSDGTINLFWLNRDTSSLYTASLADGVIEPPRLLTTGVRLEAGDQLVNLSVGREATHTYAFWNITRANGSHESWYASGADGGEWTPPQPFIIAGMSGEELALQWAAPSDTQGERLIVAAQVALPVDYSLIAVSMQGGFVVGLEDITRFTHGLMSAPHVHQANGMLTLTWAQPGSTDGAALTVYQRPDPFASLTGTDTVEQEN